MNKELEALNKLKKEFESRCIFYADVMKSAAILLKEYSIEREQLLNGAAFMEDILEDVMKMATEVPEPAGPLGERVAVLEERLNNHINVKSPWNVKIEHAINDLRSESFKEPLEFTNKD